jgi:hypothetical protein
MLAPRVVPCLQRNRTRATALMGAVGFGGIWVMRELAQEIALLELRAEQFLIHIQRLSRGSPEAVVARASLDGIMHRLVAAKGEHDRLLMKRSGAA